MIPKGRDSIPPQENCELLDEGQPRFSNDLRRPFSMGFCMVQRAGWPHLMRWLNGLHTEILHPLSHQSFCKNPPTVSATTGRSTCQYGVAQTSGPISFASWCPWQLPHHWPSAGYVVVSIPGPDTHRPCQHQRDDNGGSLSPSWQPHQFPPCLQMQPWLNCYSCRWRRGFHQCCSPYIPRCQML